MRKLWLPLVVLALAGVCVSGIDPALAGNKFQTISGGVVGSTEEKQLWARIMLGAFGGILLLSAAAAALMPHNNPLFLNYMNWRVSAALMSIFGGLAVTGAFLL